MATGKAVLEGSFAKVRYQLFPMELDGYLN